MQIIIYEIFLNNVLTQINLNDYVVRHDGGNQSNQNEYVRV